MCGNSTIPNALGLVSSNEKRLRHLICGPALSLVATKSLNSKRTHQQIAVLGIVVTILGFKPLKKPLYPSLRLIILAAWTNPFKFRSSASCAVPRVCKSVLITSNGVVRPAATPPAIAPAAQCVYGSYRPTGFINLEEDSYTTNCSAVKGTVIARVVG